MIVEMLLLVLIAAAVFAYVLAPLVRPDRSGTTAPEAQGQTSPGADESRDAVVADSQPVRDTP
jgi:hypothetical protein